MKSPLIALSVIVMLTAALALPGIRAAEPTPAPGSSEAGEGPATAYYRWIDKHGHTQYTDFEPIGFPAQRIPLTLPVAEDDAPMLSGAGDSRPSDPFFDQDQQILPIEHIGPCADARQQLAVLHSSLPVYEDDDGLYRSAWRGDTYSGSRRYVDAEARTDAIAAARSAVLRHCSDPEAFAREAEAFRNQAGAN